MRGLAGVLGAAGIAAAAGQEDTTARRRRRRRRRIECRRNNQCKAPLNPCQEARCKNNRCRTRTLADGTVCGDGLVCEDGACLCPNGVCTVRVTASNLSAWHGIDDCSCGEVNDSILTFRTGPATPPYGTGSVELTAPGSSSASLGTFQFANTPLSEITDLKYSTFQPSSNDGPPTAVGVLMFGIDFFGRNTILPIDSLVYDPNANGLPVTEDTWQEWDAIGGGSALWFYDGDIEWPNTNPPIPATAPLTWAQILATYPNARIRFNEAQFTVSLFADVDPFTEAINSVTFGTTFGTTRFVFGESAT